MLKRIAPMAIAAIALAGCGTTTIVTTAQGPQASTAHPASHKELTIGGSATLKGENSAERIEATLIAYKATITVGEYENPQPGMRYVGVTLKLTNVGTAPYSDSPSNGATILTATGKHGKTALIGSGECGEDFSSNVKIAPGESQEGCLSFEVPQAASPVRLQWTPASGFGEETAEWSLTRSSIPTRTEGSPRPNQAEAMQSSLTKCDQNISAGADTSCPFAEQVFKAFAEGEEANGSTLSVKSPATEKTYSMTCMITTGGTVTCEGGSNALVTFPLHAAQVY